MEEIKINDKIYVLKEENSKPKLNGIVEVHRVVMVIEFPDDFEKEEDIIEVNVVALDSFYKKIGDVKELKQNIYSVNIETPNGTRIGDDFFKWANKICNLLNGKSINTKVNFTVYEGYDKEKKEIKKDFPVLLIYGKYGFIIAPRIT